MACYRKSIHATIGAVVSVRMSQGRNRERLTSGSRPWSTNVCLSMTDGFQSPQIRFSDQYNLRLLVHSFVQTIADILAIELRNKPRFMLNGYVPLFAIKPSNVLIQNLPSSTFLWYCYYAAKE